MQTNKESTPTGIDKDVTFTSDTSTTPAIATALTTKGHGEQTHISNINSNNNTAGTPGRLGTAEIGGISINLPFSSLVSISAEPEQYPTSAIDPSNRTQSGPNMSFDPGTINPPVLLGAQPMAVKPVYKKRIYPSAQRPDGIIKRSGVAAAGEKTLQTDMVSKSKGNIYDRTCETRLQAAPTLHSEQLSPPSKKQRFQTSKRIKTIKHTKHPKTKPPKKPKVIKPPPIWTPYEQRLQQQHQQHQQNTRIPSSTQSDVALDSHHTIGTIEQLIKQKEAHRERLSQLATRPLPLQELQMLVCTELEEEYETLKVLGILMHKELLKLRLEEGVMLNMLKISEGGSLDVADLARIRARKPLSVKQLEAYDRMNERHYQKKLRAAKAARAAAIAKRAAMGIFSESTKRDIAIAQKDQNPMAEGVAAREKYEAEDGIDDEDHEDEIDHGEGEEGNEEETDVESTSTKYQFPQQSYLFRSNTPPSQHPHRGAIGRPEASSAPAYISLEEIKKLVVTRAKKRTVEDVAEQEADDDDLYELEFDDEEEQPAEVQKGQNDNSIDQYEDMDMENATTEEKGDEREEEGEDEDEEGEDEYYSSDDAGGDNDEDEDAARLALQRMLSLYGV